MVSVESPDRLLSSNRMHPAAGEDDCAPPPDATMPGAWLESVHRPAWAYSSELAWHGELDLLADLSEPRKSAQLPNGSMIPAHVDCATV